MMTTHPPNLDNLLTPLSVVLHGETVSVRPMSGRAYQKLREMTNGDTGQAIAVSYDIAALCLPSLTEEQVLDMTAEQVHAVIAIASQNIAEVEALFPNPKPATETPAQPSAE